MSIILYRDNIVDIDTKIEYLLTKKSNVLEEELKMTNDVLKKIKIAHQTHPNESNKHKGINIPLKKYTCIGILCFIVLISTLWLVFSSNLYYVIFQDDVLTSNYIIQNLKGDTIDTWLSWQIPPEKILYINIVNNSHLTDERFKKIKSTIVSEEVFEIPNWQLDKSPKGNSNVYYLGWMGALSQASQYSTKFPIPTNFEIISEPNPNIGDIVIILTDLSNGDGYSGFTKNIADSNENQILKSTVTIYDIDSISNNNLEIITRHEFGHVFGLAHATASEDLMAPKIITNYPYVSPCDIDAIVQLYDGNKKSEVLCEI